jgi:hypothetical protein
MAAVQGLGASESPRRSTLVHLGYMDESELDEELSKQLGLQLARMPPSPVDRSPPMGFELPILK